MLCTERHVSQLPLADDRGTHMELQRTCEDTPVNLWADTQLARTMQNRLVPVNCQKMPNYLLFFPEFYFTNDDILS
jgi:hypothetical protein